MMGIRVRLQPGCWLTDGEGDPSRTVVKANATVFKDTITAFVALSDARRYHPFKDAEIEEDFV